jgi:hypothetical protein
MNKDTARALLAKALEDEANAIMALTDKSDKKKAQMIVWAKQRNETHFEKLCISQRLEAYWNLETRRVELKRKLREYEEKLEMDLVNEELSYKVLDIINKYYSSLEELWQVTYVHNSFVENSKFSITVCNLQTGQELGYCTYGKAQSLVMYRFFGRERAGKVVAGSLVELLGSLENFGDTEWEAWEKGTTSL